MQECKTWWSFYFYILSCRELSCLLICSHCKRLTSATTPRQSFSDGTTFVASFEGERIGEYRRLVEDFVGLEQEESAAAEGPEDQRNGPGAPTPRPHAHWGRRVEMVQSYRWPTSWTGPPLQTTFTRGASPHLTSPPNCCSINQSLQFWFSHAQIPLQCNHEMLSSINLN